MKKIILSGALLLASVSMVHATPVTFNLSKYPGDSTNYYSLSNSFTLTVDGLTATFTAGAFTNDFDASGSDRTVTSNGQNGYTIGGPNNTLNATDDARIGRYYGGASVTNSPGDNSHQVDSSGWSDFITASFSYNGEDVDVEMSSVSFSFFDNKDDFRWGYDLSGDGSYGDGDFLSYRQDDNPFSDFGGVESSLFMFGAFDKGYKKGKDYWKLNAVTVHFEPPTTVPLPAGGLLLLSGLGVFAIARKRQKA
ncbi:VPLPA-CTERM sorting domain-containing protein [Roseibium sp. HPY-6]|uniref:VPLPA-CTERM sorting domain-containing protein n=1 Tax=Roseibium sp. HPY-6 TaxID=3229852 RepID=UPI00338FFDC2